ncbi:unnamed protein product [Lepeophtheirus salmonis]|uniref:(salmon louse) hypothetical protein n=1 Tax=Lepeophtheirus salmonis TaxID=72036 RepID=A0A7R8CX85_LEPSM|nr:unnamed protein product [Lepeophtheirus salmonis]CAF2959074.1 unnamed protein product [Lepeophtheirus salmonis]
MDLDPNNPSPDNASIESNNTNPKQQAILTELVKDQCQEECEPISNQNYAHSEKVLQVTIVPPDNISSETESNSEVNSAANDRIDNVATDEVNTTYIDDKSPNLNNEKRTNNEHINTRRKLSLPTLENLDQVQWADQKLMNE